jgi:hypothetical protein
MAGENAYSIAGDLGVSATAVYRWLEVTGCNRRSPTERNLLSRIDVGALMELYRGGMSLLSISKKLGSSTDSIRECLVKNGCDLRITGRRRVAQVAEEIRTRYAQGQPIMAICRDMHVYQPYVSEILDKSIPLVVRRKIDAYNDGKPKRTIRKDGYAYVWVPRESPFFCMAKKDGRFGGSVPEHRYVAAQKLGRPLESWEVVHHKEVDNKSNNIPLNLQELPRDVHLMVTNMEQAIKNLKAENAKLQTARSPRPRPRRDGTVDRPLLALMA